MSYMLSEEQQLIKQAAGEFAKEYLKPAATQLDKTGEYPAEIVRHLAKHDFLGLFLPSEFGGAGAGYLSYVLAVEELAKVSAAVTSILVHHASLACYAIQKWGTDTQKNKYLPAMVTGTTLGAFALAEQGPALGLGPDTVMAAKTVDGYILNGIKSYVTNAGVAKVYVVFACTDSAAGAKSLTGFLVDAETPGLTIGPNQRNMGLHGCPSAHVILKDVHLAEAQLLGAPNGGQTIAMETLAVASVAEAAETLGIAQAAVKHAAKYAEERVQFGKPIGTFQAIQTMLAEVATNCHLARFAIYDAASLIEQGKPFTAEAAMVKRFATRIGLESLVDAVQVEAGYGYSEEMPLARMYRDVLGTTILGNPCDFPDKLIAASLA
jgi:butyryl-CoA dehydrogenase